MRISAVPFYLAVVALCFWGSGICYGGSLYPNAIGCAAVGIFVGALLWARIETEKP